MKRVWFIAWRYLFAKKSHNAINIVTAISAAGVCVTTAALVCVLSVMNGFNDLVGKMFSAFDPSLKIEAVEGKNFYVDLPAFKQIRQHPNVALFSEVVQENALVRFSERQVPATIKGVDSLFHELTHIEELMVDGEFVVFDGAFERAVLGVGLAQQIGIGAYFIDPINLYAPKRKGRINTLRPESSFNEAGLFISGIFSVRQVQYDDNYMLVSLPLARNLFEYDERQVTSVEIKLIDERQTAATQKEIAALLGSAFVVKNRYEQQTDFFRIMKIEKWMTFFLLTFILLIASFNVIGSLSMIIIDKKGDVQILSNLGASKQMLRQIFLVEGWLISAFGALIGVVVGTLLSLLQQIFGFITIGPGFVINAYPIKVEFSDLLLVLCVVILFGFFAAWVPTKQLKKQ